MNDVLDSIEEQIQTVLQGLCIRADAEPWSDGQWTHELKLAVGSVGEDLGCRIYSSSHPPNGEWLWDITWIKGKNGFTEEILLVLESEWGNSEEISNDFQKLMPARASYRVMVFKASSPLKCGDSDESPSQGSLPISRETARRPVPLRVQAGG